tara:strand:- start:1799 stop:3718 length:1920 start_codon:yes stop_codon:yes gene_type:complete
MSKTKVPALKNIPSTVDRELRDTLVSMKEAQEIRLGRLGDPLDRAVTLRELVDSGMAKQLTERPFNPDGLTDFIPNDETIQDLSIPPAPTGLEASGAFTEVIVNWNPAQYSNHAFTEVWRSRDDEVGTAVLITTTSSFIITDPVGYDQTYFYWVRFVSTSNVRGPFNRTNGTKATTIENIGAVMQQLSEELSNLPGFNLITTTAAAANIIKSSGQPSTRADGSSIGAFDIWFDTDDGQIYTRNASNNAWVAGRDATLVNLFGSTSFTGSTLTAAMATAQSDIVTVTNAQNSTASSVTNLTSTVNGNTSSINTLNTTTASHTGDLNAMFVLQVATESNGSKSAAGMVVGSNASNGSGAQSFVQFQADKFVIWNNTNANVAPFIVSGGSVFIDSARIEDGAITNARIADATIESGKISNLAVTEAKIANLAVTAAKIANATITTAKIGNAQITNAKISDLNATKINAGFINAARIDSQTITADKINVTDLVLPTSGGLVTGSSIGNFNLNSKRYAEITTVGTGAGFYQGYVRLVGGNGQVKTIHLLFSDGTVNTTVTSGGTDTPELLDGSSGVVYRTPDIQHLNTSITESRLTSSADTANLPIAFRYTGSGTVKCYMYGQGDANFRQIGSADVRFVKFSAS